MKVLMIYHWGTGNRYGDCLSLALNSIVDYTIMVDRREKDATEPSYRRLPLLYNGGKNRFGAMLAYVVSLLRVSMNIIVDRYDVIHVQTTKSMRVEYYLYKCLRPFYRKLVYTAHNANPHEKFGGYEQLQKKFYMACDNIIVHNEYSRDVLKSVYGVAEKKVSVIAHGTYENELGLKNKGRDHSEAPFTFLFFGQIRQYKGLDVLLDAVRKIPQEYRKNMRFVIAGAKHKLDNTDYAAIVRKNHIEDCVELRVGRVSEDEKRKLFLTVDACVCPYREIYGSGVVLEAYTYGCPVICSDVPVFLEDTDNGKAGLLFESENSEDLARVIQKFCTLSPDELQQMKESIQTMCQEKYNWTVSAKKTLSTYAD